MSSRIRQGAFPRLGVAAALALAAAFPLAAAELTMDFNANLDVKGLDRPAAAEGKARFADDESAVIGPGDRYYVAHRGMLSSEQGSLEMRLRPIDWDGDDGAFKFFFISRQGRDAIILQKHANGMLQFLIGAQPIGTRNVAQAPIAHWRRGQWHVVRAEWTAGQARLRIDGELAQQVERKPGAPAVAEKFLLGGQMYGTTEGTTAVGHLKLDNRPPPEPEPASREKPVFHRLPRNIATPEHGAALLPSSQLPRDSASSVEMAQDGVGKSAYRSAIGSPDNWIEVRWPGPVIVDGFQALFEEPLGAREIEAFARVDGAWRPVAAVADAARVEAVHSFAPVATERLRFFFRLKRDQLGVRELQVTGAAPRPFLKPASWRGYFIWHPDNSRNDATRYFRRAFEAPEQCGEARLRIAGNDAFAVWLNGRRLGDGGIDPVDFDLSGLLRPGANVLAAEVRKNSGAEGLLAELTYRGADGDAAVIGTDDAWRAAMEVPDGWTGIDFDDSAWPRAARSRTLADFAGAIRHRNYAKNESDAFTLESFDFPSEVRPGDIAAGTARFLCRQRPRADYGFRLTIADEPLTGYTRYEVAQVDMAPDPATSRWTPGETREVRFTLPIPSWAPHGAVPIQVSALADGREAPVLAEIKLSTRIVRFAEEPVRRSSPVRAEVRPHPDGARLIVDGQVMPSMIFGLNNSMNLTFREFGEHAAVATGLYRLSIPRVAMMPPEGVDEDAYYAMVGRQLDQVVGQAARYFPNAYFLLALDTRRGADYSFRHPDDAMTLSDGRRAFHSFASRRWIDACRRGVTRIVTHLRNSDYAGHVAGIVMASGAGGETMYWNSRVNAPGTPREQVAAGDFSAAAVTRLRERLRLRYGGDVEALRRAWRRPDITFDDAMPDIAELRRADLGNFRDPAKGRMAMDFWESHSDAVADGLIAIAEAAKEACGGEWLVGVWGFYSLANYPTQSGNNPAALHHLGGSSLARVLASPAIDYVAAIQHYIGVRAGTPVVTAVPAASFKKHGKVFVEEFDVRTFFVDSAFFNHMTCSQHETDQILKRNFATAFARGDHCWFVGFTRFLTGGRREAAWYSDERLIDDLNRFSRICAAAGWTNPSASEVALFVNNRDVVTMDLMESAATFVNAQYNTVFRELKQMGVPFDAYMLEDFSAETLAPYRVAVFLHAFYLSAARRADIRAALEAWGKTALFLYAPGYVEPDAGLDVAGIEALTGIRAGLVDESRDDLKVRVEGNGLAAHEFGPYKYPYALRNPVVAPVFHIADGKATVLGRYVHDGRAAAARKRVGGMTSYYCALPLASRTLLADVFREAGVHSYADAPLFIEAGERFLSVHAPADYNGALRLRRGVWALECFSGERLGDGGPTLAIDIPAGGSRLYFLGDRGEVETLARALLR